MQIHLSGFPRLVILSVVVMMASACEDVQVTAVDVVSLTLRPGQATVAEGDTVRLQAIPEDDSGNTLPDRPVTWSSEDPEVAAVEDGLVQGLTAGTTRIRATSGEATAHASIVVLEPPSLVLSESELDFEAPPGSGPTEPRTVDISNGGEGTLDGIEIAIAHPSGEPTGWLEATLEGTAAPTVVSVLADPSALAPGTYRGRVQVAASVAVNSPQVIEVTFHVGEPPPRIGMGTQSVSFSMTEGADVPPSETVPVTNAGGGVLTDLAATISYEEEQPTGWLDAELADPTAPTELTLAVDPTGLASPAVLDAVVEVSSPVATGAPGRIDVRFRLGETSAEIELDPEEIGWDIVENDPSPPAREVAISNGGSGTLGDLSASVDYDSGSPTDWLQIDLSSTEAPAVLTAELTDTGLPPGEYGATIQVSSPDADNSPRSVSVRVAVGPGASPATSTIEATPTSIPADGEATSTITVQLRDGDGNDLTRGGDDVALSTTAGSLGAVSDNDDGTYTTTLTSSATEETATITGTVNGEAIDDAATVEFTAGTIAARPTNIAELLPLPGHSSSWPTSVNSSGVVAGRSDSTPVVWQNGEPMELPMPPGATSGNASSINDAGQIGGEVTVDGRRRAVLWENGTVIDIGTLPGHNQSTGGVNSAGHFIGTSFDGDSPRTGFVWRDGEMTPLPPAPDDEITLAHSGNASGLVVGYTENIYDEMEDPRDETRFVVWQDGELIWMQPPTEEPTPAPDGNEAWLGITGAGDAYIVNTDAGALWRWRDGEVAPWPFSSPWLAHAYAVSPGDLVLGALMEDFEVSEFGVWRDEEFFPIEGMAIQWCYAISDAAHIVCRSPDHAQPVVALLDFGDAG